jgi:methylenetetrahydrofolate dehydrogenase (NADP+)/methenyltetrahydrofolate cyclohydrolase
MEPILLDGTKTAQKMYESLRLRAQAIIERTGIMPTLATIIVGDDYASQTYVRMKGNACKKAGIASRPIALPSDSTTDDVLRAIDGLNTDPAITGILLQHPVPAQVDERRCFDAIDPLKDVDGVNNLSFARNAMGQESFGCATPQGIMNLLDEYGIDPAGRFVVVVGRSPILGKPLAMMMLNRNATVAICHSRTRDIKSITRQADILCVGIGKPKYVDETWVKPGVVLVDAGYNAGNVGDTDVERIKPLTSAYTPVPGGVGPMTIATLISQAVAAAEKNLLTPRV